MFTFTHIIAFCAALCFCITKGIDAECNANTNSTVFQEIDEANWDRTYSDISEDGKRPLGFQKGTVYFNSPNQPNPCIKLSDTSTRHISILVENPSGLSIRLRNGNNLNDKIEKNYQNCPLATAVNMYYEFYLDPSAGGSESDVSFWYKFTKGPKSENDREGMWCDSVNVQYPSSLLPLPTGYNPGGSTEGPAGAAHETCTSLIYTLVYLTSFICMFEIIL